MNDFVNKLRRLFNYRKWFSNNKFVLCFSIFCAFGIWLWISIEKSPVVETVVSSVPVYIDAENSVPAQLGLKVFGNDSYTVDVTVSGKKFIVSALTADDIRITAQTNYVDSVGYKTLLLKANSASSKEFTIVSLSQNYVSVYFDSYKEKEFPLEANIVTDLSSIVPNGCIQGDVMFSKSTVSVSGPSTEVNKITGVAATVSIDKVLDSTTTLTPEIELLGAAASEFSNTAVNVGDSVITLTIPVLKEVTLPTTVTVKNSPADYLTGSLNFSVYPSSVKVGVPVEKIDEIKEISVGTVDFNSLDAGSNNFTFKKDEIVDYYITDSVEKFRVNINLTGVTAVNVNLPASNISIVKQRDGYSSSVVPQTISNVKIVGPTNIVSMLSGNDVYAEIDLSQTSLSVGNNTVPVIISVVDDSSCWVHGEYTAQILTEVKQ